MLDVMVCMELGGGGVGTKWKVYMKTCVINIQKFLNIHIFMYFSM